MTERRNNKLEVKLELMKSRELGLLSKFSSSFASSVNSLDRAMSRHVERIEKIVLSSAGGAGGGLRAASTAVVAGSFAHAGADYASQIGQQFERSSRSGLFIPNGAGAPAAGASGGGQMPPLAGGHDYNEEIMLGTFMNNPLRAFTTQPALAAGIGWATKGLSGIASKQMQVGVDANNEPIMAPTRAARNAQFLQNNPQAVAAGITTLGAAYMGANFASGGYMGFAQQAGLDTGAGSPMGIMAMPGLNLFTEGGSQAFKAKWSDKLASIRGDISGAQLAEIRGTVASMGMTQDPDNMMRRMTSKGYSMSAQKAMIDRARRYRPQQIAEVEGDMESLAQAARAAGVSVSEFQDATMQAAATMSRELGIDSHAATKWAVGGAAYGFTPEQTASMASRGNTFRTMGMMGDKGGPMGQRYYDASRNPSNNFDTTKMLAGQVLGPDIKNYKQLAAKAAKGDKAAKNKVGRMDMVISSMGDTFNGMTGDQISNLFDKDDAKAFGARMDLSATIDAEGTGVLSNKSRLKAMLKDAGVDKGEASGFLKHMNSKDKEGDVSKLKNLINGSGGATNQSKQIGLTPDAKRLVKLMDGGADRATGTSDTKSVGRTAVEGFVHLTPGTTPALSLYDAIT